MTPVPGYVSVTLEGKWEAIAKELVASGVPRYRELRRRKNVVSTVLADLLDHGLEEILRDMDADTKARVLRSRKSADILSFGGGP